MTKEQTMIRGSTLITLGVVLGLACVLESEKREVCEVCQSVLVDIDPKVNAALDDKDQTEDNEDDNPAEHVSDPLWFWRSRRTRRKCRRSRYRYRRRPCPTRKPYPTHRPYPTHKPHTPTQACSTSRPTGIQWDNVWRGKLFVECPRGYSLISIKSVFRDCQHDRIWKFGCGYNEAAKEHCHWSHGYANDEKEGISFRCPNNGFVSGIDSIYTNGDRRFKFKCCNDEGFDHTDCHQSHLLNLPGQDFEFKVDRDKRFYITGISSFFIPAKRDRRWKIAYCKSEAEKGQDYSQKKVVIEN